MTMRRAAGFAAAILATAASASAQANCGGEDAPCGIAGGEYFVALPAEPADAPVVLWLHGYGGSGRAEIANAAFVAGFTERGYAMIAPDGQRLAEGAPELDWGVVDGQPPARDDVAFLQAVIEDATARFRLDPDRVLAAGFSRGGSMIWDLACKAPELAAAFAPVSGAFWQPMAETCAAPVHLLHSHGFSDRTVPLEGRAANFGGFDFVQGNVFEGLEVWRRVNGCPGAAETNDVSGPTWTKAWTTCAAGSLALRLGPGGHGVPADWSDTALDWFEALSVAGQ